MTILDNDLPEQNEKGKQLGKIAAFFSGICIFSCLIAFYGIYLIYSSFSVEGSPLAIVLSEGLEIALYCQFAILISGVLAFVIHLRAFKKYDFNPIWQWRLLLIMGLLILMTSIVPLSILNIILALFVLVHTFLKKQFYQD